jgi:hypothetical protein
MDKSEENTTDVHSGNKIKEAARKYAEAGLNIVPVDGKKPLIE